MDNQNSNIQVSVEAQLDDEISTIKEQIKALTKRRAILTSTLLSSRSTHSLSQRIQKAPSTTTITNTPQCVTNTPAIGTSSLLSALSQRTKAHQKQSQERLYRMCAGCTTFEVRDPDPNAVDGGRVLGVRMEVCVGGKFLPPYYLLLTRPYPSTPAIVHIHRSTIPPCIPLSALAARYLPRPPSSTSADTPSKTPPIKQNLPRLVRELRRELVSHHLRISSIDALRRDLGLGASVDSSDEIDIPRSRNRNHGISEVATTDAEARDIRIEWTDSRVGKLRLDKMGRVSRCVILGNEVRGRERGVAGDLVGVGLGDIRGFGEALQRI
ncbi:MAG: hypothetical protein M1827_007437 [Pycnora praestabilis]|nr:MAG: hypothetical protein M1827_007437 [Pycnora praestabilis]